MSGNTAAALVNCSIIGAATFMFWVLFEKTGSAWSVAVFLVLNYMVSTKFKGE